MSMAVKGHHAHLKGRTIYTNDVGIDLLCLLYGVPTTSESGQAEARYPAFFLSKLWGSLQVCPHCAL